ncbi:MAG: hypothetical protein DBX47_07660 [Clostridiales bacterium]|nr:MAG: hypothetical protein DBX47_07660 [Clostridiales bacterium]
MKKFCALIISIILLISVFSGCSVLDKRNDPGYTPPVPQEPFINSSDPVTDGSSSNITQELLIRISKEEFIKPKNIIFMIGDGMGFNSIRAAKLINGVEGNCAIECLPIKSKASTYSTSEVTDSAAGATALATGFKTNNGVVGMTADGQNVPNVLELAASKGLKTGVVATKTVTDATPAGFTAHVGSRSSEEVIASQQIEKLNNGTLDLLLGGGRAHFTTESNQLKLNEAINNGLTYITDKNDLTSITTPVLGLFQDYVLPIGFGSSPNLAQMTQTALNVLKCDEGFFLMIEGSQIDTSNHANNEYSMASEFEAFDAAVALALRFVAENPDTVLIVTADHETGGISLPDSGATAEDIQYTTTGHTGVDVPVFAIGYGTESLVGSVDNTDLAKFVAKLLGENNFGRESDLEYLKKLKTVLFHSAYVLGLPIKDVFTEYFGKIVMSESRISKTPAKAEKLKESLSTEINCAIPYVISTDKISDNELDCQFIKVDITVLPGTEIYIEDKQLPLTNNKFSSVFESGKEIVDSKIEFTLKYRGIVATVKHCVRLDYEKFDRILDFSSSDFYNELKKVPSNKFEEGCFKLENEKLFITYSTKLSRFSIPSSTLLIGKDLSKYNGIRIVFENKLNKEVETPSLYISSGTSLITTTSSKQTVLPGEKVAIDYFYDTESYGIDAFKNVAALRIISDLKETFTITECYAFYKT